MITSPSGSQSPAAPGQAVVAKPGAACLVCRRRKLKCTREPEGCTNCLKGDLPCVYPAPDLPGAKRKRGPYKKDKPARERHLEDLVRYLEPRAQGQVEGANGNSVRSGGFRGASAVDGRMEGTDDLVKDALIALTMTSVADQDQEDRNTLDGGGSGVRSDQDADSIRAMMQREADAQSLLSMSMTSATPVSLHPSAERIFEFWQIFTSRVDPLTKVIHCPSFLPKLVAAISNIRGAVGSATEILMFSVYFCAITACTPYEFRQRFSESQQSMLQYYGRAIESALSDNYEMPSLETLQALVLYIIACRRRDHGTNLRALFSLAVRLAQMLELHEEPKSNCSPFETEMRRRTWWNLCNLESRGAEEGSPRTNSIMEGRVVELPANLNDVDLDPRATEKPESRDGATDISFVLIRMHIVQLMCTLRIVRKIYGKNGAESSAQVKAEQSRIYKGHEAIFERQFFQHLHPSRPYDWMCLRMAEVMSSKARISIDHPLSPIPTKVMSPDERLSLVQSSISIISVSQAISTDKRIEQWLWFFRGYTQWHAVAVVVAELGHSRNSQFSRGAWAVLDPILQGWNEVYRTRRDEPAWDHVNALISRARRMKAVQEQAVQVRVVRQQQQQQNQQKTWTHQVEKSQSQPVKSPPSQQKAPSQHMTQNIPDAQQYSWNGPGSHRSDSQSHRSAIIPVSIPTPPPQQFQPQPQQTFQQQKPYHGDVPSTAFNPLGCGQTAFDIATETENIGFGVEKETDMSDFDMLKNIDFGAFDAVFADEAWEFPGAFGEMRDGTGFLT